MKQGILVGDLLVDDLCSADLVFFCTGATPQTECLRARSFPLTAEGRLRVDAFFQVEGLTNALAIGDCCAMEQMFWHAPKHALVAAHNIGALCRGKHLKRYRPHAVPPLGLRLSAEGPLVCSHNEAETDPLEHALR